MTITQLATRIEHRLAEVHEEISRLQAADEALAASEASLATPDQASERHRPHGNLRAAPVLATSERGHNREPAPRGPKPAAVLALARELDAGLRNRP